MLQNIRESIKLDLIFITKIDYTKAYKLYFLFMKYLSIFSCMLNYKHGKTKYKFLKKVFYVPNKYGLVSIQRVYCDNYFLKTFIPKNALVIDIGAHVGEFNLFCSNYLEAKRIYSFEPYQKSYSLLQMNVEKNLTYNYAIYPKDEMILYISQKSTQLNSVIKENTEGSENSEKIKCVYLDKIVKELIKEKYFDLLKIDVEGSEYEVLKTAIETIKVTKYLLIEISINRESKLNFIDFFSYLISNFNFLKVVALNNYNIGNRAIDILFENIDWRGSK